jgi:hypothetical protein
MIHFWDKCLQVSVVGHIGNFNRANSNTVVLSAELVVLNEMLNLLLSVVLVPAIPSHLGKYRSHLRYCSAAVRRILQRL